MTDGLFEARSGRGTEHLGENGLLELARSLAALPGAAFVDTLIDQAEARAQAHGGFSDDVAVVRVERRSQVTPDRRAGEHPSQRPRLGSR